MPPKKKEQDIDLSTLPDCKSINIFLHCRGRRSRAEAILAKIDEKCGQYIFHVKKANVLDYAKEKGIYVDPDTLTDKQKKDAKFMDSVCTELSPSVFAKATDAYLNNQNVKIRVQKKNNEEKSQAERQVIDRKYDCAYVFDDFPTESQDFDALAKCGKNIDSVMIVDTKVTWVSAPEEPQPNSEEQEEGEPEPEDEEIANYKRLKLQEQFKPQDIEFNNLIDNRLNEVRKTRREVPKQSGFRNTVIEYIPVPIDPYHEQQSQNDAVTQFLSQCDQIIQQRHEFEDWKRDKVAVPLIQQEPEQQKLAEEQSKPAEEQSKPAEEQSKPAEEQKPKQPIHARGQNTLQILLNLVEQLDRKKDDPKNQSRLDINFNEYDFATAAANTEAELSVPNNGPVVSRNPTFIDFNEPSDETQRQLTKSIMMRLRLPGIDRFMMPEVPVKSQGRRKMHRAAYGQFLPQNLSFEDFEHKLDILFLESVAKEEDEERTYNFSDRIFEQQHNHESLMRELNSSLLFDDSTIAMKYNENNDKLYLLLLYKTNPRRVNKKYWESSWKVLPNFELWLRYFKHNEANLLNTHYYDIDYESIGNIQEEANVYTMKGTGVIVQKKTMAADQTNRLLYCLVSSFGQQIFGVRNQQFYCENPVVKAVCRAVQESEETEASYCTFLTFKDGTILELKINGDLVIRKPKQPIRTITKQGYCIIHEKDSPKILHPQGGITQCPGSYINEFGRGKINEKLQCIETLKRHMEDYQIIKRDDGTVIVNQHNKKWIRFPERTEYLNEDQTIVIEKQNYPLVKVNRESGNSKVSYYGIEIETVSCESGFRFVVNMNKQLSLHINRNIIEVQQAELADTPYVCDVKSQSIERSWSNQKLKVWRDGRSEYHKGDLTLDPLEDEQNYTEHDTLPEDCPQPRLFIISNDNTGTELLSRNQLAPFLHKFDADCPNYNYHIFREDADQKEYVYAVMPVVPVEEQHKKFIRPRFNIDLDVFQYADAYPDSYKSNTVHIRSFVSNHPIMEEDRHTVSEINRKCWEWIKQSERDNNEYGNRPRNDPSSPERYSSKKTVLEYRIKEEPQCLYATLREQAITKYNHEKKKRQTNYEFQLQEEENRKRMSQGKEYVSKYPDFVVGEKTVDANSDLYFRDSGFYPHYFNTVEGKRALSLMPEWVFRPKENKQQQQLDPQIALQLSNSLNATKKSQEEPKNPTEPEYDQANQRYDTVEVDIEPQQIYIKPSVFTQKQIDEERFAFNEEKKAYQYHEKKRKQFDVYGKERHDVESVPAMIRHQPSSELNQKYLVTEAPVDKKIKTISMKNKLTSQASSMIEMRKEGPHSNLIKTLDKRNDYSKLLERRTMMVQADLNDRLQRDILINPVEANFGFVIEGRSYETRIEIKNEDVLSQRIIVKKPKSVFCRVHMKQMGPIALGMTRTVFVTLRAAPEIAGRYSDQFEIMTKHEIYHIPVNAQICTETQFETGRHLMAVGIKEVKEDKRKRRVDELPPIN